MISVLIEVLLPIAVVAAVGYALRRKLVLDLATLNRVMIYGFSPALIFTSLLRTQVAGEQAFGMIGLSVALVACVAVATWLCALPLRLPRADLSALLLSTMFLNSGNYGLPAARFAFGESGFERAVLFFIPQSILAQTLGIGIAAAGGMAPGTARRAVVLRMLRQVLTMPQIYAVAAALLARALGLRLDMPGVAGGLLRGVALLSEAALPLMLTILGMQLAQGVVFEQPKLVALASGLRLLVSPLLAWGLALALGLDGLSLAVAVMQAAMPTAVNVTIAALEFNTRPSTVVASVVVTSLGSLVTLTVILSLLR
ncbi:MAG: AEC family transporter [Chloroflexaceae bacterium]|jgi:hypothetical protein|nr:AEC family transporter [Chloroflexaceae bacterium]